MQDPNRWPTTGRRLGAGVLFGLLGLALDLFPIELLPGVHLLPGLLGMAAAAVLFGPLAGAVAGALSALPTQELWGHPWAIVAYTLEGIALGWLARRTLPVFADLLWWIVGLPVLFVTYVEFTGIPAAQLAVIGVKQPLNSLLAVLAVQGLLLLPRMRHATHALLPPSLRDAGLATTMATALALGAGLPLLVLGAQEGRDRYLREIRALSIRNLADARIAAAGVEQGTLAAVRALTVLADTIGDEWEHTGPPTNEQLRGRLERLLERVPELINVYVGDPAGRVVVFEPPLDDDGTPLAGRDLSRFPEVQRELTSRDRVITGFFASRLATNRPIVVVLEPIFVRGTFVGFVSGAIDFREVLERSAMHLQPSQSLRLVDREGMSLVRAGPGAYVLEGVEGSPLATAIERALRADGTSTWVSDPTPVPALEAERTWQLGAAAIDSLGWRVAVLQPQAVGAEHVQQAYLALLASVGAAMAIVVLAALAFIPVTVRPVRAISAAAARFAAGERTARAGPATADAPRELRRLGEDFDRMAAEIARQLAAVEAASRAKDEFLSIASHELKTPLTSLKTQVQLLRRRLPESADRLERLDKQIDRLTRLVNQLLDASRVGISRLVLEPVPCDLAEIARRVAVGLVSEAPGYELRLSLEPAAGCWDELRLEQVAHNLVANAVKYSPGGGPVEVAVRRLPEGGAILQVADRGIGLAGDAARLFERFHHGNEGTNLAGLGVGLSVSREIVQRHGGSITIARREGGGTVATVTLPPSIPAHAIGPAHA